MSFATRCPECGTAFRLSREQLDMADGWARCGQCDAVFRASDHLFDPTPPWAAAAAGAGAGAAAGAAPAAAAAVAEARSAGGVISGFGDEPMATLLAAPPAGLMPDIDLDLPGGLASPSAPGAQAAPSVPSTPSTPRPPEEPPRPVADFDLDIPAIDPQSLRGSREAPADDPALWESLDRTRGTAPADTTSAPAEPGELTAERFDASPADVHPAGEPSFEAALAEAHASAQDTGAEPDATGTTHPPGPSETASEPPTQAQTEAAPTPEAVNALYASVAQRDGRAADASGKAPSRGGKAGRALSTVAWSLALLLTIAGLVLQWARVDRDTLAAEWPELRPALQVLCEATGCEIRPLRNLRSLVIDNSTLEAIPGTPLHRWTVVLRHRGERPTLAPSVELAVQGEGGAVVARRVFSLAQLGQTATALEPRTELKMEVVLALGERPLNGHTAEIFYP